MNLAENKENAITFYKMAFERNPSKAIAIFSLRYIQENMGILD